MFTQEIAEARKLYDALGYETVPLEPNTKKPIPSKWQKRTPREMWKNAPENANIGLRCGGFLRFGVLDGDDKNAVGTSDRITRYLDGLGLHEGAYPLIATPSNSRHFYLALAESVVGNYCHLSPEIGAGEFRYGIGAQVAASPSIVGGISYRLIAGDFARLPTIRLADIRPILVLTENSDQEPPSQIASPPAIAKLAPRSVSRAAWALIKGKGIERYPSRSEAEQAILTSLINTGHDFESILAFYLKFPCAGKFHEMHSVDPNQAIAWLKRSYQKAHRWSHTHESQGRRIARGALAWARQHEWSGRTARYDRVVFLAHAKIAFASGRIIYAASCRDLSLEAGVNHMTAARSTNRLRELQFVALEQEYTVTLAAKYRIGELNTLPHREEVRECIKFPDSGHDVFRYQGLGKTAAQVWDHLLTRAHPLTDAEIADETKRSIEGVKAALTAMHHCGMVSPADMRNGKVAWEPNPDIDLDEVAINLGVSGIGEQKHELYTSQRKAYHSLYPNPPVKLGQK